MRKPGRPDVLLFDIGGVLIDFDWQRMFTAWEPISRLDREGLARTFGFDLAYEQHERGEITAEAYFDHLGAMLQLQGDRARIAEGWNNIFLGEIGETMTMLQAVRGQIPCYAFTNTNRAHYEAWAAMFPDVLQSFERIFTSFETACRKPEPRVFEYVARTLEVSPDAIMFFDDAIENVQAASSAGLSAVHVRSPADVRDALLAIGCRLPEL